jgi:hypothetical protein
VESVTISTDKGWDLSELVDLEIIGGDTLCRSKEVSIAREKANSKTGL